MQQITLPHSGIQMSAVIAGCWQAGRDLWTGIETGVDLPGGIDDDESIAALSAAFDHGITTFDTAEDYGDGHSERIVARALSQHRHAITIATKVSWHHLRSAQIIDACEQSLKRLQTDYIDLYQIHWPSGTFASEPVPLAESMAALEQLREQGKIRAIGVSNFNLKQLEEACALGPVDSVQPPYSLFWRGIEADIAPFCHSRGIAVLAYSPLAQGLLTGKYGPEARPAPGDNRADNKLFQAPLRPLAHAAAQDLAPIAERLGISRAQLALAWVIAHPNTAAIAGLRTPAHARDNAGAGTVRLSASDVVAIEEIGARVTDQISAAVTGQDRGVNAMWTWEL